MPQNWLMLYVIAVILAGVLFGTNGTAQALGPEGTSPFSLAAVRLIGSGVVMAIITVIAWRRTAHPPMTARALGLMAVIGFGLAAFQPFFYFGALRNGVAVGTIIALGSAPVLAGVLEWIITRKRPSALWAFATLGATVGVALLSMGGEVQSTPDALGVLSSLAAGASFAVTAVAQRRVLEAGWSPLLTIGIPVMIAALLATTTMPFNDFSWLATPRGIGLGLWLALASMTLSWLLFTWGLSGVSAGTAATLTLSEPLTATLLGVTVLGERLSTLALIGLVLVFAALVVIALGSRRQSDASDPEPYAIEA